MPMTTPMVSRFPWWAPAALARQQVAQGRLPGHSIVVNSPSRPSRGGPRSEAEMIALRREAELAQFHREAVAAGLEDEAGNVLTSPSVTHWMDPNGDAWSIYNP